MLKTYSRIAYKIKSMRPGIILFVTERTVDVNQITYVQYYNKSFRIPSISNLFKCL